MRDVKHSFPRTILTFLHISASVKDNASFQNLDVQMGRRTPFHARFVTNRPEFKLQLHIRWVIVGITADK